MNIPCNKLTMIYKMSELHSLKNELSRVAKSCNGDQRPECPIIGFLANKEN